MSIDKLSVNNSLEIIDQRIGQRIRMRRNALKYTLHKLASMLQLSFQQVQKYEKGTNRIVASRLLEVAYALNVPVNFFFDEVINPIYLDREYNSDVAITAKDYTFDSNKLRLLEEENYDETVELLRAYYSLPSKEERIKILQLIKNMTEK